MKKNGFTLIELLAVIVILAIIALIATPIILGIINDAREKSNERSVELYAAAVKNGIAAHQLRTGNEVLPGTYNKDNKLPFEVEYDGDVECTSIIISDDSKVSLLGCTVNDSEKQYSYGIEQGETPDIGALPREDAGKMSICNPLYVQTEGVYTAGDKYQCDVDPNKQGYDQIFYVLNSNATSVNLIMDSNIRKNGEAVKESNPTEEQKGLVAWITKEDYTSKEIGGSLEYWNLIDEEQGIYEEGANDKGPITAMNYLESATKKWTNVNLQTISSFTSYSDTITMGKTYEINARLPYVYELEDYFETGALFLYDYIEAEESMPERNAVSGVGGYWLFDTSSKADAIRTNHYGGHYVSNVSTDNYYGVRPVINLSI